MRHAFKALALLLVLCGHLAAHASAGENRSRVTCYTAYDTDYFYVAAVVQKPNLAAVQAAPFGDPLKDDAIAVYMQAGTPAGVARTDRSLHMAVSALGGAQLYRGAGAVPLAGFQDFRSADGALRPFKAGATHRGTVGQTTGVNIDDCTYTVEMAVPWVELGGAPKAGDRLRFNVVAFSAAPGTSAILSLAPGVKVAADLQNPSLWTEVVFVDAPVRSVASAPNAVVCARVFTARPLVDGTVSDGEWNRLTSFAFEDSGTGSGAVAVRTTAASGRVRPNIALRKATPPVIPPSPVVRPAAPRSAGDFPRLVLTLYHYDYQGDTRKAAPANPVRAANGASLIASHPIAGAGPWMTYDRVDWHRGQLEEMRRAGIDVVLPVYRASLAAKQGYAQRGLITLGGALRSLASTGRDYPLVGMYLDAGSLEDGSGGTASLGTDAGQARLYEAIREFFAAIPADARALVGPAGQPPANLVVLSSASQLAGVDPGFVDYCRSHFAADFGTDLVLVGGSDFKGRADLDGYVDYSHGRGTRLVDGGRVRIACVGVGFDATLRPAGEPSLLPRDDGDTYRKGWKQAMAGRAQWVLVDDWNGYAEGTAIAPTYESGIANLDITREFAHFLHADEGARAAFTWHSIPAAMVRGAEYAVAVRVTNTGNGVWAPATHAVAYQWGDSGNAPGARVPLPVALAPGESALVRLLVAAPANPGDARLSLDVVSTSGSRITAGPARPLVLPVRIASDADPALPTLGGSVTACDMPTTLEAGGHYQALVTLRNDGSRPWRKADGTRVSARLWRYTSAVNATGEAEGFQPIEMADASAELPADVAPGQEATVTVPVTFSTADGAPLVPWSQADNWVYQLRWEVAAPGGRDGVVTPALSIALVDADIGASFVRDVTPPQLPGERRVPVRLAVRNQGPQTWRKEATRVGYHWYYLDGTEAVWEDETTPVPQDVAPGSETPEMLAWITAPPYDGTYWLVWDVKIGDTWASTMPSVRPFETRVHQVEVVHGRLAFADLDRFCNVVGVTPDYDRASGDFDGSGRSLPAELVPPLVGAATVPQDLWGAAVATGLDSSRRISFRWTSKAGGDKNVVQCLGQRIPVGDPKAKDGPARAVHILAAATRDGVTAGFTVVFADTSQQFMSFPLSRWDAAARYGEPLGYACRYSHTRAGEAPGKPVALFHYVLPIADRTSKRVVAVILPNAPDVRVAAITVER